MESYFKQQRWYIIAMGFIAVFFIVLSIMDEMYPAAMGFLSLLCVCGYYYRDMKDYQLTYKTMEFNREWGEKAHQVATEAIALNKEQQEDNRKLIEMYGEAASAFVDALRLLPEERWNELKPETKEYINKKSKMEVFGV